MLAVNPGQQIENGDLTNNVEEPACSKLMACSANEVVEKNLSSDAVIDVVVERPKNLSVPFRVWVILFISSFGVFLASVSTSALIIAFPVLLMELHMTLNTMMWVLLVLLLILGAVVPMAGKLGDVIGQAIIYKVGYWCFVIGSLGAGFVDASYKGYDLVAARVVIGFGASLLFTNSSAILTNAFAPYGKVGMSQGVFQLFSALGMVLGPLIGGAFATSQWRWIFWFNVPPGGLCALLATIILKDEPKRVHRSAKEHVQRFDFIGSFFFVLGLILILMAMIQGVVADPLLSQNGPLAGIIVGGIVSGLIFIVDQFFAIDPLIPPDMFLNPIFTIGNICGTLMAFVRNSITYNMIFFLQGPLKLDPLEAGIELIPFGIGIMVGGFTSGGLSDKLGVKPMIMAGPLITLAGAACLSVMDEHTSRAYIGGILFISGLGIGVFQSPNGMMTMLSVPVQRRGVASAIFILTMAFCMMLGITITFSLVLHSMSSEQLFAIFINGGGGGASNGSSNFSLRATLDALATDYYIVIAFCGSITLVASFLPGDLRTTLASKSAPANSKDQELSDKALVVIQDEIHSIHAQKTFIGSCDASLVIASDQTDENGSIKA